MKGKRGSAIKQLCALSAFALLVLSSPCSKAAVIAGPDVNGYGTFIDTNTNYTWLKLDNFAFLTYNQMADLAIDAGFTLAGRIEVQSLLDTLPLGVLVWSTTYAPIMGKSPSRNLIWGGYLGSDPTLAGYAFANISDPTWTFRDDFVSSNVVVNGVEGDMDIWAYQVSEVPLPAALPLYGTGLGVMGLFGWWRRRRTTARS
jgi:hypothetical protein